MSMKKKTIVITGASDEDLQQMVPSAIHIIR